MKSTARDILKLKGGHLVTISCDSTVYQALTLMTQNRVGSVVALEGGAIVGIYTERDLMFHVLEAGFDPKFSIIREHMSENLITANVSDQVDELYKKFIGKRVRHLLIEENGEYIGLLSVGDVVKANLVQKSEELEALNQKVSLEYYENWKDRKDEN